MRGRHRSGEGGHRERGQRPVRGRHRERGQRSARARPEEGSTNARGAHVPAGGSRGSRPRWVDRWSCLEDIDDLWADGLLDDATPEATLSRAARVGEALAAHLAEPGVSLVDILGASRELQGWFVTLLDEAEVAAAEDPGVARIASPSLEWIPTRWTTTSTSRPTSARPGPAHGGRRAVDRHRRSHGRVRSR